MSSPYAEIGKILDENVAERGAGDARTRALWSSFDSVLVAAPEMRARVLSTVFVPALNAYASRLLGARPRWLQDMSAALNTAFEAARA